MGREKDPMPASEFLLIVAVMVGIGVYFKVDGVWGVLLLFAGIGTAMIIEHNRSRENWEETQREFELLKMKHKEGRKKDM